MRQTTTGAARLQRLSHPHLEPNPALVQEAKERAQSVENRIADRITVFAGSMRRTPALLPTMPLSTWLWTPLGVMTSL